MESTIRDYNKLITYYTKLSNSQQDSDQASTPTQSVSLQTSLTGGGGGSPLAESFSSLPVHLLTQPQVNATTTASSSASSSPAQTSKLFLSSNNNNVAVVAAMMDANASSTPLKKPDSLFLHDRGVVGEAHRQPTTITPTLSFSVYSSSGDDTAAATADPPPPPGQFVLKKPIDEDELNASGRWSLAARKRHGFATAGSRKSKSNKVSFLFSRLV